jgi:nitrate reductase NapE component
LGRGGLLVQWLLLLWLWPGQEAGRHIEVRCGHEGLRMLLSSGHGAGVHSHVPLQWVVIGRPRCIGLAIGTSGGGGLARRAPTTSAVGTVLVVVVIAITTIAVLVVGLGPVATGAAVTAMGRARWVCKMVAWPPGTQRWCRAPLGQPEA